ncbi:hypothetical protein [Methanobrevibacter sp.]|uniref:hypothetical protein n=1 Tax=Methanobrevibacter sp. TaxID=66852 RepID=UPI00386FB6D8
MTEKQFTDIEVGADTGRVRLYNGINFMEYSSSELLDLLNEQHENILFKIKLIDSLQDAIGELKEENERLKQVINENEKLIQSTYDELTKLRCIKKNLGRIKTQWDWIMEAIQYD